MASTNSAENTNSAHDLEDESVDAESLQPEKKPGDHTKVDDAGTLDGGTTAWLVVLGAWCCSFSSPGWINSA